MSLKIGMVRRWDRFPGRGVSSFPDRGKRRPRRRTRLYGLIVGPERGMDERRQLRIDLLVAEMRDVREDGRTRAPDRMGDERAEDHSCGGFGLGAAEDAGSDAALDHAAHQPKPASEYFFGVEARQFWKVVQLAGDEAVEAFEGR